jgi:hypothetical protein
MQESGVKIMRPWRKINGLGTLATCSKVGAARCNGLKPEYFWIIVRNDYAVDEPRVQLN